MHQVKKDQHIDDGREQSQGQRRGGEFEQHDKERVAQGYF